MSKPFSQACENNKQPILAVLREAFATAGTVLEIGSGTGQHAVFFAAQMPWLRWLPSDCASNLAGIRAWCDEAALPNLLAPIELDVTTTWPALQVDAVFSANTAHIMPWPAVEVFFAALGRLLPANGVFALYGPFNYGGHYTSESNADFDQWLKAADRRRGIRDFEAVNALAEQAGFALSGDHAMPANNRTLVWRKAG